MKTPDERLAWMLEACHQIGIRSTPVRQQILLFFASHRLPVSLEIISRADGLSGRFDSANLYRTLMLLKEAGIVRVVGTPHKAAYFVINHPEERGHFLICRRCSCIRELPLTQTADARIKRLASACGFSGSPQDFAVFGLCQDCHITSAKSTRPSKLAVRREENTSIIHS